MSANPRPATTATEDLPHDLVELRAAISELPPEWRQHVEASVERVILGTRRRRKIMNLVQDALSQLRLDMKYLMFDLEATRRERDDYKRKLDGKE
jgi:hypothetical protein